MSRKSQLWTSLVDCNQSSNVQFKLCEVVLEKEGEGVEGEGVEGEG